MKAPKWRQNVLIVSGDPEIISSITPAFGVESTIVTSPGTEAAIEELHKAPFQVIIIDAKTSNPNLKYYEQYYEEKEETPFIELSQLASQLNQGLTIIVLVNKLLSKEGDFARKCGATLIMDRKNILLHRMVYLIDVLRKRTFRTILSRDILIGTTFDVDIYHHLSLTNRYVVFLPAGTPFTFDKLQKISESHIRHLYVTEKDLSAFLITLRKDIDQDTTLFSESLASIRNQYRQLLIQFFDLSTDGMIHYGKSMYDTGMDIANQLEKLVNRFPGPAACLLELPYPRWSSIAHSINCSIYTILFAKHCNFENRNELVFAAMFHNLGLSEIDQNLIRKSESELTPKELEEYKTHMNITLNLLRKKFVPFTPLIEKLILFHHENFDGTGYPLGMSGALLPIECSLISLVGSFDYFNTARPGDKPINAKEAWQKLKQHHADSALNKKFSPKLIEKLDEFFKITFE